MAPVTESDKAMIRFLEFFTQDEIWSVFRKLFNSTIAREALQLIDEFIEQSEISSSAYIRFYTLFRSLNKSSAPGIDSLAEEWWNDLKKGKFAPEHDIQKARTFLLKGQVIETEKKRMLIPLIKRLAEIEKSGAAVKAGQVTIDDKAVQEPVRSSEKHNPEIINSDESYFIENAGIVLLYPFIGRLFKEQELLSSENVFADHRLQLEACYLLQYIATGNPEIMEYDLLLNKILCGYPEDAPVSRTWLPEKADPDKADIFLREIIEQFPRIGIATPAGLRNSFLLRSGKLIEEELNWILYVERKSWDMLLDSLPYPLSIIKLPWMIKPLYVQW
jgi:hypothetical protein